MATDLPPPPVPPECDCTDLDGFMLNVERLMASELVALSGHEVVGAALFLWCRAWKQRPAASVPDDNRVMAAYARLTLKRFRQIKDEVLRGFVKCSDGRLYHLVLAVEALKAWEKKKMFQAKREADAERLRKWRQSQRSTGGETRDEPTDETRFVPEGQGQGQGQGQQEEERESRGPAHAKPIPRDWQPSADDLAWAERTRADIVPARLKLETEGFKNHALANNRMFHEVGPAWRNWVMKARVGDGRSGGGPPPSNAGAILEGAMAVKDHERKGILDR